MLNSCTTIIGDLVSGRCSKIKRAGLLQDSQAADS